MFVPFYLCTAILGLGAVAIIGGEHIGPIPPLRDITLPALAGALGGPWLVGVLGALGFLIVAGVMAALLMSAVTSATHDYRVLRDVPADPVGELSAARRNTLVIGVAATVVSVLVLPIPTHSLIPITVSLAGSAILPAVLYTLFWKRYNTAGLKWTIYGGLGFTAVVFLFSALMTGSPVAVFPSVDIHFVNVDPALIGLPVGFLLGYFGTVSSSERNEAGFAELQVRALAGAEIPATTRRRDRDAAAEPATPRTSYARMSKTSSRGR